MQLHFFSLITSSTVISYFIFKFFKELKHSKTIKKPPKLPPGPYKLPIIGNLLQLSGSLPHRAITNLAKKYGPLMHLQLGEISAIVISSPRVVKQVLQTHDLAFADRPKLLATTIVLYNNLSMGFAPYGDYWIQIRKICTMELLSSMKVHSFQSIREEEVWDFIESIRSYSYSSSNSPINLTEKIYILVSGIVCRAVLGKKCEEKNGLIDLIQEVTASAGGFDVSDLFPSWKLLHVLCGARGKLEKLHMRYDKLLDNIINERRKEKARLRDGDGNSGSQEDLLDVLLRPQETGGKDSFITYNSVKVSILDMFTGGTDTSVTTIEWAMAELVKNPRVMEKTQVELRQTLKGKKIIREDDIQGLKYFKFVVKETLRLHPPSPMLVPRVCREQCEIDGYTIPIKTNVIVNAWAIGRDPEYWDDAETFKPERFNNHSIDFGGTNFEYIPFGAGRRMCPGVQFGIADVELPLAQLLYHFNWKLHADINLVDLNMSEKFGAIVKRSDKLNLIPISYIFE